MTSFIMVQLEKNINLHKSSLIVHLIELFSKIYEYLCWTMMSYQIWKQTY